LEPDGSLRLTTRMGGADLCLDLLEGSNRLTLAQCVDSPTQRWRWVEGGGGTMRLTNVGTGPDRCVDVINDGANNQVHVIPCANYSGQFWSQPSAALEPSAGEVRVATR
jgi:hypothetical protein